MAKFWNRLGKAHKAAPFLVFAVALLPRIASLGAFVTWDEPMWVYRSIHFLSGLLHLDLEATRPVGHPGVITMISGAIGVTVRRFLMGAGVADVVWLSALPTLEPTNVEAMRRLAPFLTAAKVPLVVLHATCIAGMYLLLKRLLGFRAAAVAAALIALDPFHIALSRVLHIDGAASDFMMLSLLALLLSLRNRGRLVLLSGALAGLAFLSKSYSLFLVPFTALVLGAFAMMRREPVRRAAVALLWWCLAAGGTCYLLWPAMWVDPVGTARSVVNTALGYAADLSETSQFFMGHVVENAGPLFYPVALAFRTTPLAWVGLLALSVVAVGAASRLIVRGTHGFSEAVVERWLPTVVLVAYVCLFCAIMSLASKKFDRYMLPIILALDILAAIGLVRWLEHLKQHAAWLLLGAALLAQGAFTLSYHPYYLAYYNPLVGGSRLAPQVMPLGWGEGMDLAASYLNDKGNGEELAVATAGIPGFAPFFEGRVEPMTQRGLATSDYAVLYVSDVQQKSPLTELFIAQQPEAVMRIHGINYAWLFPNEANAELASFLQSQVASQDAVLTDATSPLDRNLPEAMHMLDGQTQDAVVAQLRSIAARHQYLYYVHYPESDPDGWINRQLAAHALRVGRESFGQVTVSRYFLPPASTFGRAAIQADAGVRFGDKLRLVGHALDSDTVEYRQELGVTLLWQSERLLAENYAVSLRLLDGQGSTWAKEDSWLLNSAGAATPAWKAGDSTEECHLLSIPPGIPPGPYELKVLIYDAQSLEQVPVLDQAGTVVGTEYSVATVEVAPPSIPPTVEEVPIPHALHKNLGQLQLLGFDLTSEEVAPGQRLELSLFWMALQPVEQDRTQLLTLRDEAGHVWSAAASAVANEYYPVSQWRVGEVVHTRCQLRVDAGVPSGTYSLFVSLSAMQGQDAAIDELPLTELTVHAREHFWTPPEMRFSIQARVGDVAALVGYDLDRSSLELGGALRLTLYWQPLTQVEHEYKVFTHLMDSQNRIWGQQDSIPCLGACGTTTWVEGEFIVDTYTIDLDPSAPAGEYQISVGMYDPMIMKRLPALDDGGTRWSNDCIVLPVRIDAGHAGN